MADPAGSVPDVEAQLVAFDLTTGANQLTGIAAGTPAGPVRCVSMVFFADSANASTVLFGANGTASMKLTAGVGGAMDAPQGLFFDLSTLTVNTIPATSGLVVHVLALII
jgi:hypothetical protein